MLHGIFCTARCSRLKARSAGQLAATCFSAGKWLSTWPDGNNITTMLEKRMSEKRGGQQQKNRPSSLFSPPPPLLIRLACFSTQSGFYLQYYSRSNKRAVAVLSTYTYVYRSTHNSLIIGSGLRFTRNPPAFM